MHDREKSSEQLIAELQQRVAGLEDELTQSKRAEASLRERNENLESAVENQTAELCSITDAAHDAILLMDPCGAISYWNAAAERLFGVFGRGGTRQEPA